MLEVRDIWKSYEGKLLLRGVTFAVKPGETVCLLGPSGSGKSTLLRIIAGLEKPESGQVLWDDRDLAEVPVHLRHFGLMFQDYALFPHRSVGENVAFGLRMQGMPRAEVAQQVEAALRRVNMASFAHRRVTDLSGGEQQRVALARALAPHPRLLMLDEPLGALDRALKEQVEEELRELLHAPQNGSGGIPAIYVTHDQEEAFAVADRLILLNQGRLVQSGSPGEVYEKPVSPWVAQFLGLSNLLSGQVESLAPLTARTDLGLFRGAWAASGQPEPGDRVTLLLRPRGAVVKPTGQGGENVNQLTGVVEDSVFSGDGYRVHLRGSGQQPFTFILDRQYDRGERLLLAITEESVQFLKENG